MNTLDENRQINENTKRFCYPRKVAIFVNTTDGRNEGGLRVKVLYYFLNRYTQDLI